MNNLIPVPDPALYWPLTIIFVCLAAGTAIRYIGLRHADPELRHKRLGSLGSWWILASILSLGILGGRLGLSAIFATASCVGWWEYTRLCNLQAEHRLARNCGYVLILTNYALIAFSVTNLVPVFLPVVAPIVIAVAVLIKDQPANYIRVTGGLLWGVMFLGYGVSHAAFLMILPETQTGPLGSIGWVLFLLLLTECDDIFQAIVGRRFGRNKRHPIAPRISPNKTVEGFIGGMLVILVLAPLLAPWLTMLGDVESPWPPTSTAPLIAPVLVALLISLAGYYGDINMSGIKRDAGVKDSSNLLPGMGGVIDRIDSLTLTAPVYLYFIVWWID